MEIIFSQLKKFFCSFPLGKKKILLKNVIKMILKHFGAWALSSQS